MLLQCEMFLHRNCHASEISEANCRAGLSRSKQLLRYSYSDVSLRWCTEEKTITLATPKKHTMTQLQQPRKQSYCAHNQHTLTQQWHQSASQKWSIIHHSNTCQSWIQGLGLLSQCEDVTTVAVRHTSDLGRVHLLLKQYPRFTSTLRQSTLLPINLPPVDQF